MQNECLYHIVLGYDAAELAVASKQRDRLEP